jgi:hypothetical protein
MTQALQTQDPLASLSAQARSQLEEVSHTPFSGTGFRALQEQVDKYIGDLILESVRIMERRQADTVSRRYVQQASENITASSRRRIFTLVGTLGGVFLGTAASSYYEIVRQGTTSVPEVLVASLFAVAGAFMIALQFTKE